MPIKLTEVMLRSQRCSNILRHAVSRKRTRTVLHCKCHVLFEMIIEKINGVRLSTFSMEEIAKLIAAIDGELTFAIRDRGEVTLRKAPIEQQGS